MLEDTLDSKKLYDSDGNEMVSFHLSYFAFSDNSSAFGLLVDIVNFCLSKQVPAVFVSLTEEQFVQLKEFLVDLSYSLSKAWLFSDLVDVKGRYDFNINTADI